MKIVVYILVSAILISVLKSAVMAFLAFALLLFIWGALFRTEETLGMLVVLLVWGLIANHPVPFIWAVALAVVAIRALKTHG